MSLSVGTGAATIARPGTDPDDYSATGVSVIGDLPDSVRVGFGQIPKLVLCGQLCHMVCDISAHTILMSL